jgi:cytoskeletal protein CcmA (bactofilin family)
MSKPATTIASHTRIKGDVQFDGPAVIAGHIQGNILALDVLEITAEGIIDGNIQGPQVVVLGTIKGNVMAARECQLGATARVVGDLCTADLAISKGARFIGQLCIADDAAELGAAEAPRSEAPAAAIPAKPAPAIQVVEATIQRVEHEAAARQAEPVPLKTSTVTFPTMSPVEVLSQHAPSNLNRAPRIIKAR